MSTKRHNLRIATSALGRRIFAGRVNKDGTAFIGGKFSLDGKVDVTSDVLKAVIDFVEPGHVITVEDDGVPAYEISVRAIAKEEAP